MRLSRGARVFRRIAVTMIVLWSLLPVLVGVVTSLTPRPDVQTSNWLPAHPTSTAYSTLINGPSTSAANNHVGIPTSTDTSSFGRSMFNSALVTVLATIAILAVSTVGGFSFARLQFRGSRALFILILATLIVPVFTIVIALFRLLADFHLIDTYPGLVLVFVSVQAPLGIWLFHNYCKDLPREPEEAALIDGCTRWQAFRRVVLPQMRSGIAALGAIFMLAVWGEFLIPLLLSSTLNTKPVTVLITEFIGKYQTNYPLLMAAGVLAMIPPALVALVLNRQIRGVLGGSVG
jgi:multiple sugar transport system permease protein